MEGLDVKNIVETPWKEAQSAKIISGPLISGKVPHNTLEYEDDWIYDFILVQ